MHCYNIENWSLKNTVWTSEKHEELLHKKRSQNNRCNTAKIIENNSCGWNCSKHLSEHEISFVFNHSSCLLLPIFFIHSSFSSFRCRFVSFCSFHSSFTLYWIYICLFWMSTLLFLSSLWKYQFLRDFLLFSFASPVFELKVC